MTVVTRIDPPLPLETTRGKAMAHFLIDYGFEHFVYFVCFVDETRECWTFSNTEVKIQRNETARPAKTQN